MVQLQKILYFSTSNNTQTNLPTPVGSGLTCAGCGNPYKADWTKGKTKFYPYYTCQTKRCPDYGKSIKRADIETGFETILQSMTPSQRLFNTMKVMINNAWEQRKAQIGAIKATLKRDITKLEKEIDEFLNRIVSTQTTSVINIYEKKIAELEHAKLVAEEKLSQATTKNGSKTKSLELSLQILANPWKIWENGTLLHRRMLLRLAFADYLTYCRNEGYRTPKISIPFKVLDDIQSNKCKMVLQERIELSTSSLPMKCSTTELLQQVFRIYQNRIPSAIALMLLQGKTAYLLLCIYLILK